jgi:AcrR family transcriptional regulator
VTSPPPTQAHAYHHGDLPNALRSAAAEVLAERGTAGFSMREVARRAGVSHAAPAHHFGDAQGLLTAVAVEAFEELTRASRAAVDGVDDPVDQLGRLGRAYVEVSRSHPGHCAVVFAQDAVDCDAPAYRDSGRDAYEVLRGVVTRLGAERNPDLDVELAAATCWAMVQGLLTIHEPLTRMSDQGDGPEVPDIGDLADAMSRLIVDGLAPTR